MSWPGPEPKPEASRPRSVPERLAGPAAVALLGLGLWLLFRATAEQSFTLDEPYHLLAGLQMHQHGVNTVNLDHPPLFKWLAAWPLAGEPALAAPPLRIAEVREAWMALFADPAVTHRYLLASRGVLLATVALPLLGLVYGWGRRFGGATGFVLLMLLLLAPFSLPYLPLVMTDAAVTLGFVAGVAAATRYAEAPGLGRALLLGLAGGLALAAKFSGLLLLPALAIALVLGRGAPAWRRAGHALAAATAALALLYGSYALANRRPAPERVLATVEDYLAGAGNPEVGERLAPLAPMLRRLTAFSPELGQYATGVLWLAARDQVGVFASVAFGQLGSEGRWWYFPALLLVQAPLVLLGAGVAALAAAARAGGWRRRLRRPELLLPALATAIYLAAALGSRYNLGLRHLLPVMPFLLLPLAHWIAANRRRQVVALGLLALESTLLAPLWMSATQTWWLGAADPWRTAFSAFEYKQTLGVLAADARARGEGPWRVFYPLLDAQELHAYFPEAEVDAYDAPLEPGLYAVNLQAEILLPAIFRTGPREFTLYTAYRRAGAPWLRRLRAIEERGEDLGWIAGTFHLYRVRPAAP